VQEAWPNRDEGALDAARRAGAWTARVRQPGATQRAAVMLAVYGVSFCPLLAGFVAARDVVLSLAIAGTVCCALQGTLHICFRRLDLRFCTSRYGGIHFGPS
jgi:hypothetical protein